MPWRVESPDGIPDRPEPYPTREAAMKGLEQFCDRFKQQGYYSAVTGRIPIESLPHECAVFEVDENDEPTGAA